MFKPHKKFYLFTAGAALFAGAAYGVGYAKVFPVQYDSHLAVAPVAPVAAPKPAPVLDKVDYDARMLILANNPVPKPASTPAVQTTPGTATTASAAPAKPVPPPPPTLWPVKGLPYPNAGAILPFSRVVAYYGNFYSTKMGVLGEYAPDVMIAKLLQEKKNWEAADPTTPVVPAIHYIAETAQGSAGADGKYRFRMPDSQIDQAIALADKVHGIVILDLQVALSNVKTEIPIFEKYLKMPQVHLGLDPEFSMKTGAKPGTVIGTMDAADINFAANYLATLVKENNLPPKILVIHRFTQNMLTNYKQIKPLPEVQIVEDMDGWGFAAKKINTYNSIVADEPIQFTGFKLFYKNDLRAPSTRMLTPAEILNLSPKPIYIQYQ
jgi:hypothetical protein